MLRYDPLEAPDPEEWLELDEQERIDLVLEYLAAPAFTCRMKSCTPLCTPYTTC